MLDDGQHEASNSRRLHTNTREKPGNPMESHTNDNFDHEDPIDAELARHRLGKSVPKLNSAFGIGDPANDPPEVEAHRRSACAARNGKFGGGTQLSNAPAKPATTSDPGARGITETDIGNGRRFVADHGDAVRYVADMGQWFVWTGQRWEVDRSETQVERLAKATADMMAHAAATKLGQAARSLAEAGDEEKGGFDKALTKAKAELSHAKKSADMRAIRRMLQAARSEPGICIPIGGAVFDVRRDLLNCPNGTIELRTGKLRPHDRRDFITRLCSVPFEPSADRSVYLKFLETTFHGREAVARFVRELSGCIITGEVSDQALYIFNGDGSNGKNVLVDAWKSVLGEGEYAHSAAAELLVGDGWERHPTEKTGLRGARLVVCSETGEDGMLDEAKMKSLTGGDTVTARYMRGDFFQFEPTHKLILLTNNRPRVKGTDHGVWRRIRLVPFAVRFWKEADRDLDPVGTFEDRFKADPGLGERLRTTEAKAVLADMVEFAVKFYSAGRILNPPSEVILATAEYRDDQDTIGQFFAACVVADPDGKVTAKELYGEFKNWWEAEGHQVNRIPGSRKFGQEAKRKFSTGKASTVFYRVRILSTMEREDGRMGVILPISAREGGAPRGSIGDFAPILPSSLEDISGTDFSAQWR